MRLRESTPLHIIAPSYDPQGVPGASGMMRHLTDWLLELHPETYIHLSQHVEDIPPKWKDHVIRIQSGPLGNPLPKSLFFLKLLLFGWKNFPQSGVCWFPFTSMLPYFFRGKGVATIHDTLEKDVKNSVGTVERLYRGMMIPRTVKACRIVTCSEFSREQIKRHYKTDAEVIPHGLTELPDVPVQPHKNDYVFYPANHWPHKNHRFLIELWRSNESLRDLTLVFTLSGGMKGLECEIERARKAGVQIEVTRWISDWRLAELYHGALCVAMPTLYEGFGLPIQEALTCNCPVIVSNCGGAVETAGHDYPYILPLEPDLWVNAINGFRLNRSRDFRKYLQPRNWKDCAEKYLEVFGLAEA